MKPFVVMSFGAVIRLILFASLTAVVVLLMLLGRSTPVPTDAVDSPPSTTASVTS